MLSNKKFCDVYHIPQDSINITQQEFYNIDNYISNTISYLCSNNIQLVKGDLVVYECIPDYIYNDTYLKDVLHNIKDWNFSSIGRKILIFNGKNLIHLDYTLNEMGSLPTLFKVLNDNTPITYWSNTLDSIIWFDHNEVKVDCIKNIKYREFNTNNGPKFSFVTFFIYNSVTYYILFNYVNSPDYINSKDKKDNYKITDKKVYIQIYTCFMNILNKTQIVFNSECLDYYNIIYDNILFINYEQNK